jgi:hypothetical protein
MKVFERRKARSTSLARPVAGPRALKLGALKIAALFGSAPTTSSGRSDGSGAGNAPCSRLGGEADTRIEQGIEDVGKKRQRHVEHRH